MPESAEKVQVAGKLPSRTETCPPIFRCCSGSSVDVQSAHDNHVEMVSEVKSENDCRKWISTNALKEEFSCDGPQSDAKSGSRVQAMEVVVGARKRKLTVPTRVPPIEQVNKPGVAATSGDRNSLSSTIADYHSGRSPTTKLLMEEATPRSMPSIQDDDGPGQSCSRMHVPGSPVVKHGPTIATMPDEEPEGPTDKFFAQKELPYLTKILRARHMSSQTAHEAEDSGVLVVVEALRSDGAIVIEENTFLKKEYPTLLINFYEQLLRYEP